MLTKNTSKADTSTAALLDVAEVAELQPPAYLQIERRRADAATELAGVRMNAVILQPPKIYLDTNHLANIAKVRQEKPLITERFRDAYDFIDDCIRNRHFGVIFNPSAPLEWAEGNATLDSALELARVIDSAKLQYQLEMDKLVWTSEIMQECKRQDLTLVVPEIPILTLYEPDRIVPEPLGVIARRVPGYLDEDMIPPYLQGQLPPEEVPLKRACDCVPILFGFKQRDPETYRKRVAGYREALLGDMSKAKPGLVLGKRDMVAWMKRFLKIDKILEAFNPDIDADALIDAVEVDHCPAVRLWFRARQYRIRAGHQPSESEVDDWMFLPVVSYADLVLTDRNYREYILQADRSLNTKVTADPDEAVKILKKWT